jgi:hypothetical protein
VPRNEKKQRPAEQFFRTLLEIARRSCGLVFVVLEALLKLVNCLVSCPNGFDAMAAEIVGCVLEVLLGAPEGSNGLANLRMPLRRGCRCGVGVGGCTGTAFAPVLCGAAGADAV